MSIHARPMQCKMLYIFDGMHMFLSRECAQWVSGQSLCLCQARTCLSILDPLRERVISVFSHWFQDPFANRAWLIFWGSLPERVICMFSHWFQGLNQSFMEDAELRNVRVNESLEMQSKLQKVRSMFRYYCSRTSVSPMPPPREQPSRSILQSSIDK